MSGERNSIWHKRVDTYSLLLGFFFIFLLVLMGYLYKIDQDIRNYDRYHHRLDKMRLLTYQFDNFLQRSYRYIDYDETSKLEKRFQELIDKFDGELVKKEFGEHVYREVVKVKAEFKEMLFYFEDFKALNARVTNSIHYLFDLRKTLEHKLIDDKENQVLVDNAFFSLSQILMQLPYDEARIQKDLLLLQPHTKKYPMLAYFIQHTRQFLNDVKKLDVVRKKVANVPLRASINILLDRLEMTYRTKRYQQRMIAIFLFGFAFVILGLLIYSYRRIRKNAKELQAFRYAIEGSDNMIVMTNAKREIEYVNLAFEERSGYSKEEVMGKNPNILKSNLLSDAFYRELNSTLDRGEIWQGELINRRKDGSLLYEKASIIPIFIDGELVEYLAVKLDITDYKEQQQKLKQAAVVYNMIGDGILVTDSQKRIISVNPSFVEMFGYEEEELLGSEPMVIRTLQEDVYFYRQMWEQLLNRDRWSGKLYNQAKDGTIIPVWLTLTVVRNEKGEIENFIAIYTNLQEIIATQERAEYLAYHDSLTGLPNRAYFDLRIMDILEIAEKRNAQVAIFFLDLDRFKVINDTLGHSVGDGMLVELAKRIQALFDEEVLFARMGGDEFVITFIVKHGRREVEQVAEKILSVIREPIHVHDYYLNTTASIGIALFPDDAREKHEIVKYADSAMYAAKEKGKDNYQFYTRQLSLDVQARLDIEQELLHALEREELYLHYQPQYRLDTGEVTGVEALLRWKNKIMGDVSPEKFISIAEETGLIVKIGYFVFEEACRCFKRLEQEGCAIKRISVNISAVQFREEHFLSRIEKILLDTGMNAESVDIEITERFIMEYSKANMTILEDLRKIGCHISIDDFGTGYSSMSYMKQLPLDTVKIDRSFITDLPDNMHDAEVSRAIIALSKSLGYQVVAEGIENAEQENFLKENGCDTGQGFYFARPMDENMLKRFLEKKEKNSV